MVVWTNQGQTVLILPGDSQMNHWLDCARGLLGHSNCPYLEGTREAVPINWCCPRCRRWSHGHRDWTKVCRQVRRSDAEHRPNRADICENFAGCGRNTENI